MLLLVSLFVFFHHTQCEIFYEHMYIKYRPLRSFSMIRFWVEGWHWPPCYQKDGFDIIEFGWVKMHVSRNQSGKLVNLFLEGLFGFSTGCLMLCIDLRYNIKLQTTRSPPYSYFCAYLFEPKQLHLVMFFLWSFLIPELFQNPSLNL